MKKLNPLTYLKRTDKWYLGGGNRLLWAPPFPVWLQYPGFWDKASYFNYDIEPVFTWTVLDEEENEISLRATWRTWDPSKLVSGFEVRGLRFEEEKCCLPNDVLTSVVQIKNTSNRKRKLHFIAWTVQPHYPSKKATWIEEVEYQNGTISHTKHLHRTNAPHLPITCSLGMNKKVKSYSINLSEGSVIQPYWSLTPFAEKFLNGKLPNEQKFGGMTDDGLVFMALHTSIELKAKSREDISVFFSASPSQAETLSNIHFLRNQKEPIKLSEQNWNDFFSSVPYFECSNEYLTRYYWYRWYGLKLHMINAQEGNYTHPFVCEGIDYFRAPIAYSAMCHILETRWRHDPTVAQGILLTFLDNQREDGGFRGYIDSHYYRQEMFYHANWGNSLRALHAIHPDNEFLSKVYDGLKKYVEYFDRERDKEGSGLYDITNHYETGQEYSSRYLVVNPNADKDNWGEVFRLKGVDVTVYVFELKKTLMWIAEALKMENGVVEYWKNGMMKTTRAVLEKMWDSDYEMFFDVNPLTWKRTMVKAPTCFYPYMTDIVEPIHVSGFKSHLFNPKEFWSRFPVPSLSADDAHCSSEAEWKGKRMNCPWNGRVWPMTNSHIAEALATTAMRFNDKELRAKSVEFISKFIRMMFFDNDPQRPNCFEHYNPLTGKPSAYRGIDDYMHSWIVDLIIKYVVGLRVEENKIIVDPFTFPLKYFYCENLFVQKKWLSIERKEKTFITTINGKQREKRNIGNSVEIPIEE